MVVDENAARILARFLDAPEWYPSDEEYPGDPKISPETLWKVLRQYHKQQDADALGLYGGPEAFPAEERVTALEALTCVRLLMEALRVQRYGLVYNARRDGDSWADVGQALDVTRQSAHEMYAQDLAERAEWWKGKIGADSFARRRPELEAVLNEQ